MHIFVENNLQIYIQTKSLILKKNIYMHLNVLETDFFKLIL